MIAKTDRIVLIGGSGFIGRELTKTLLADGFSGLVSLSRRPPKNPLAGVQHLNDVDITKPETLGKALKSATVVINLAGLVSFAKKDQQKLHDINVQGARNILAACEKRDGLKRFVHLSSTAALGYADHSVDEEHDFPWEDNLHLHYSRSKYLANVDIDQSAIPTNIIFPSLVLGPSDEKSTGQIFDYVQGKRVLVVPPGKNSFIDVRDLAQAIKLVLEKAKAKENFIAATQSHSFAEIFGTAAEIAKNKPWILVLPEIFKKPIHAIVRILEGVFRGLHAENIFLGFQQRIHNTAKIRELGFTPKYSLHETLRDYWEDRLKK